MLNCSVAEALLVNPACLLTAEFASALVRALGGGKQQLDAVTPVEEPLSVCGGPAICLCVQRCGPPWTISKPPDGAA